VTTRTDIPLAAPLAAIDNIVTVSDLRRAGLRQATVTRRCRPGGPWRKLAPGVVMLAPGEPTRQQLLRAAVAYLGPDSVITGVDALNAQGLRFPCRGPVHALVPPERRLAPPGFLLVERTAKPPQPRPVGGIPFSPPERAVLDAARREQAPDRLQKLLTLPLYEGLCSPGQLRTELDAGNQRGSAAVRELLRHLERTQGTYVFGLVRRLLRRSPLPAPRWNATVCDLRGRPLDVVDAWWDEVGMGWQVLPSGAGCRTRDLAHLSLTAAGVVLVRSDPELLRTNGDTILRELATAFRAAATRPRPRVQCAVTGVAS
jgi:hypothetical protein